LLLEEAVRELVVKSMQSGKVLQANVDEVFKVGVY
jgi:hypothetical protein